MNGLDLKRRLRVGELDRLSKRDLAKIYRRQVEWVGGISPEKWGKDELIHAILETEGLR